MPMKTMFRRLIRPILELQARRLIARKHLKVVAVSGALGKTTTKTAIATVLGEKYRVLVHTGYFSNFNSEIGLPLAIFELKVPGLIINPFAWVWCIIQMELQIHRDYPYNLLVLELGTDKPGDIPHFMTYLKPDIGIVTAVAAEHMEFFADLDAVAAEELALVAGSKQAVVGYDDVAAKYRHHYVERAQEHHVYYGLGNKVNYGFEIGETDPVKGTTGTLFKDGHAKIIGITFGLYGRHSAKAAIAAYAVADLLGLTRQQTEKGIAKIRPVNGRMNPLPGINGAVIIDDSYNSSPEAAFAALESLSAVTVARRRIAVMGSMNELGTNSQRYHEEVGAACTGVDLLVTVGELANKHLGPAAVKAGLDERNWKPADSPYAAGEFLKLMVGQGDVVLAKGSQNGVFTEETVKLLLADPADSAKLVRQSPAWMRIKREQFPDADK